MRYNQRDPNRDLWNKTRAIWPSRSDEETTKSRETERIFFIVSVLALPLYFARASVDSQFQSVVSQS